MVARSGEISKNVRFDSLQLFKISAGYLLDIGLVWQMADTLSLDADSGGKYLPKNLQDGLNIKWENSEWNLNCVRER